MTLNSSSLDLWRQETAKDIKAVREATLAIAKGIHQRRHTGAAMQGSAFVPFYDNFAECEYEPCKTVRKLEAQGH